MITRSHEREAGEGGAKRTKGTAIYSNASSTPHTDRFELNCREIVVNVHSSRNSKPVNNCVELGSTNDGPILRKLFPSAIVSQLVLLHQSSEAP